MGVVILNSPFLTVVRLGTTFTGKEVNSWRRGEDGIVRVQFCWMYTRKSLDMLPGEMCLFTFRGRETCQKLFTTYLCLKYYKFK